MSGEERRARGKAAKFCFSRNSSSSSLSSSIGNGNFSSPHIGDLPLILLCRYLVASSLRARRSIRRHKSKMKTLLTKRVWLLPSVTSDHSKCRAVRHLSPALPCPRNPAWSRWTRERDSNRMKVEVFQNLCESLQNRHSLQATRGVDVDEQVAIFLFICGQNASSRLTQERFQHSGDTTHWHFNRVLQALVELHTAVVTMPTAYDPVSADIARSRKFFPYFRDCVGALDGTHIPIHVPTHRQAAFRNRKSFLSQNVIAACLFDLSFCYVLAG
ncbi:hypothetical protein PsorP6_009896 [Peronosclerospora sorghi]|uniref:Uncharacterized protein n=1 Tax=Peronosclerospora sorghi TaxID=230839 RepID=A0ACC0W0A0_9STRA|nr:hypothetical protein PsorP6_009896 [Peronosclerospora sorghi]